MQQAIDLQPPQVVAHEATPSDVATYRLGVFVEQLMREKYHLFILRGHQRGNIVTVELYRVSALRPSAGRHAVIATKRIGNHH